MPEVLANTYVFNGERVRVINRTNGPEFIARDACSVLGITNVSQALDRLDEDEKGVSVVDTPGGEQRVLTVTESGLYALIMRSNRPEAKPFRKWVTSEVLPSIRKTGAYVTAQLSRRELAAHWLAAEERAEELAAQVESARPAVEFHDRFVSADGLYKVGDLAKVLAVPGLGQNKLFSLLRERGVLMSGGRSHNVPYQRHVDAQRFVVKVTAFERTGMTPGASSTTYVTPKGVDYVRTLVTRTTTLAVTA